MDDQIKEYQPRRECLTAECATKTTSETGYCAKCAKKMEGKKCPVDGCERQTKTEFCRWHTMAVKNNNAPRICAREGCRTVPKNGEFCYRHSEQFREKAAARTRKFREKAAQPNP